MKTLLALVAATLAGCASPDFSNISDAERAQLGAALLARPQYVPQPMPYLPAPTPYRAVPAPLPSQTFCQWQRIGNMTHRQCF